MLITGTISPGGGRNLLASSTSPLMSNVKKMMSTANRYHKMIVRTLQAM